VFGSTVELEDQEDGSTVVYQLVGDAEADIRQGWISVSSPIARALSGKAWPTSSMWRRPPAPAATKSFPSATIERGRRAHAEAQASRRSKSSARWLQEHVSDEYVKRARQEAGVRVLSTSSRRSRRPTGS